MFLRLRLPSRPTLAVCLATFAAAILFVVRHDFVAMWIEGFAEYIPHELAIMGLRPIGPGALHIGASEFPYAFGAYTGCAGIYFDLPAAYAWVHGWISDPFLFRFGGLVLLSLLTWTLYATLRRYADRHVAMWAALIFMSLPTVILFSLTDRQVFLHGPAAALLAVCLSIEWVERGTPKWLAAAAFAWGLTVNTRIEALAWPGLAAVLFVLIFRPPAVLQRIAAVLRRPAAAAIAVCAFIAGLAPFIAYNLTVPENQIFSFFWHRVVPNTTRSAASGGGRLAALLHRLGHFRSFSLLNQWSMYDLATPNHVFAVAFAVAAIILAGAWIVRSERNFALFVIAVSLPLSTFVTGSMREEHLALLQPAVVAVLALGIARIPRRFLPVAGQHAAFALILSGSLWATASDYHNWVTQAPEQQTMLNQSDPVLLTKHLQALAADSVFYTNIGLLQYVAYTSRGAIQGADVTSWEGDDVFAAAIRNILTGRGRRVIVAISPERDGSGGNLPRTKLLYQVLAECKVPFRIERLSSPRNPYLYDLIVIEPGVMLAPSLSR